NFASDTVTKTMTLFAKWELGSGSRVDYTPTMTDANTLYIHYLRTDGNYNGWCAWVWKTGENGKRKTSVTVDKSGTVIAANLSEYGNPSEINFKMGIINEGGNWEQSDGGDNKIRLSDAMRAGSSYHWFVRENETSNGTAYLVQVSQGGNGSTTEPLRESAGDVNRSYAANLPTAATATTCDEMGVGYQIFVASFCDSDGDGVGDIRGIINKLDYLEGLNVDVLWLTPVQSSNSYHGYDCYDYYSIDPKFGTNADYRELVYKSHQRGIKVIMDLVVNHTSPQNEWFIKSKQGVVETVTYRDGTTATVKYRDFYRWSRSGGNRKCSAGDGWYFYSSFGDNMPELNYDCQAVRNAMADVAAYWLEYGLDGFRMDAIKHVFMWDESNNAGGDVEGGANDRPYNYNLTKNVEFFKEFNYKLKRKAPYCFLLGEQLSGDVSNVSPFYAGMDSLFDFNTYYDLPTNINGGNAGSAATAFNNNAAMYKNHRGDRPINSMISSNHDIPRLSSMLDAQKAKLYFAVTMTMPGLAWIYYGDEIGLNGAKGNDSNYRQSMKWTANWQYECHNDISRKDLNGSTVSVADQLSDSSSLLNYVKSLAKLRNDYPVLVNGTATCSTQDGMLKISVQGSGGSLTVYHNFSNTQKQVSGTTVFGSNTVPAYGTAVVR
ncbi:MAG: hypothetical protein J1G04_07045, partial [Clostridiales bacterium]|nr:hypothetical protein [Clostridiales bacterium]